MAKSRNTIDRLNKNLKIAQIELELTILKNKLLLQELKNISEVIKRC